MNKIGWTYNKFLIRAKNKLRELLRPTAVSYMGFKAGVTNIRTHYRISEKKTSCELDENIIATLPHLRDGDVIYDIGANIGFVALMFASQLKNKCKVYSVEPNPENISIINFNNRLNGTLDVIFPICAAVGSHHGLSEFKLNKLDMNSADMGFYLNDGRQGKYSVYLPVLTLDDLPDVPDVIKIDVDGGEDQVVKGGEAIIRACRVVNIEVRPRLEYAFRFANSLRETHDCVFEKEEFTTDNQLDFMEYVFVKKSP